MTEPDTDTETAFDFEIDEDSRQLLINDFAPDGNIKAAQASEVAVKAVLEWLIDFSEDTGVIDTITINTSCMSHIDPLEETGFTLVHEEAHFVTAEYNLR